MDTGLTKHLKNYWIIYAFIVQIIVGWTLVGARLESLEIITARHEIKIEANALNGAEINSRLASIETSLEFIKAQLR